MLHKLMWRQRTRKKSKLQMGTKCKTFRTLVAGSTMEPWNSYGANTRPVTTA